MKRITKSLALALLLTLLMGTGASAMDLTATTVAIAPVERVQDTIGVQRGTELVVGSTTELSGHFGTEAWGNNTSDMDVRTLLHGYQTVAWTRTLGLAFNATVVGSVGSVAHTDGSRTYTLSIVDGLTYNDGTPVTARDYVFSMLLLGSPELQQIGGTQRGMSHVVGYEAYQHGESETISGVRLLSDKAFSMHITTDCSLYFYGLAMLNVSPYPIDVIAPGCVVRDDGAGVYLAASGSFQDASQEGYKPGVFSAEMLQKTLLDAQTGYEYFPMVTTGPYQLDAYDRAANEVTFSVNETYQGNYEGQKPHIEKLKLVHVRNPEMIDELTARNVQLLNKVSDEDAINAGRAMREGGGQTQMQTYPRTGLAFLAFACEQGPVASADVRRAIAMSLDKDQITLDATGGYAQRVYGYYGIGQWMTAYDIRENPVAGVSAMHMPDELAKLDVAQDIAGAIERLEKDGWTLNAQGGVYQAAEGGIRYRQGQAGLEPFTLTFAKMADSAVADVIEHALLQAMESLGGSLEVTEMPFPQLLRHYYRQDPRTYDLFYLASNFTYVFDPYYDFHTDDVYQGMSNKSGLKDEQLMLLTENMRVTPSTDLDGYARKWLDFQKRFVNQMPMVPLYSNMYYDFFIPELQGYDIASHIGWGLAIPYAYMQ